MLLTLLAETKVYTVQMVAWQEEAALVRRMKEAGDHRMTARRTRES